MLRRGLIAAVVLALVLAPGARTRATDVPLADSMFGVSVNRVINDDFTPAHWDAPLAAVAASGIRQARTDAFWGWAEPLPPIDGQHDYRWPMLDAVAGALAQHGLRWLPVLDYSAPWAESEPGNDHSPPTSNDDYAAYAGAFAARYGRGGSYWLLHPDQQQLPVTTYEIWNEPNGPSFWHPTPDPAVYADMYLKARAAIKAVDPDATVVVGGLVADAGFVRAMYAARPDLRANVDAVGWHAYAPTADGAIRGVRGLRRTLVELGEGSVPIDVSEIGWPTRGTGAAAPIVQDEQQRAHSLEAATDTLARSDCGVSMVVPYTWRTPEQDPAAAEDWYGLTNPDGSASPSRDAFARVVARWTSDPPGDSSRLRVCHALDADHDGTPDSQDADDDNDGVPDTIDAFPLDPREWSDLDHDGLGDRADADDDGDGLTDRFERRHGTSPVNADTDGDGVSDRRDHHPLNARRH